MSTRPAVERLMPDVIGMRHPIRCHTTGGVERQAMVLAMSQIFLTLDASHHPVMHDRVPL
jgi:hypothetical protein